MYVITADQKNSRKTGEDAVSRALRILAHVRTVLPFERTVGDEIQGVVENASEALKVIKLLANLGGWVIGMGIDGRAPTSKFNLKGDLEKAMTNAHRALKLARKNTYDFVVISSFKSEICSSLQALLQTKIMLISCRTERQKQVIAIRENCLSGTEASVKLGVSKAAVSKILKASFWELERGTDLLATKLLEGLNC